MAGYRQIHTKIWKDEWFLDLDTELKLLFIYFFSNDRANLAGLYDLPLRVVAFETELPPDKIQEGLAIFHREGKAFYEDGWIWVPNLLRYNAQNITSIKIQTHLRKTIDDTPDIPMRCQWIEHYNGIVDEKYRMDTLSIPLPEHEYDHEQEQEQEQEHEQEQEQESYGADAPTSAPTRFEEWLALVEKPPEGSNRTAQLVKMHGTLFPARDPPGYGYVGKTAKTVGGAGRLAALLWQASGARATGDVLRYCMGIAKGKKKDEPLEAHEIGEQIRASVEKYDGLIRT